MTEKFRLGAGGPQETSRIVAVLQEGSSVDQSLGGVPNYVADGVFGVDAQQVLQDAEKRDLLGGLSHLLQYRVEDVQRRVQVHAVGALQALGVVAVALLVEHVQLDGQLRLRLGAFPAHKDSDGSLSPLVFGQSRSKLSLFNVHIPQVVEHRKQMTSWKKHSMNTNI